MRITNRQLRRIIREEKVRVLAERRIRRIIRKRLIRNMVWESNPTPHPGGSTSEADEADEDDEDDEMEEVINPDSM